MSKGLDYDALFPGRFLKAGEFNGRDVTLTITGIELEQLPQEKGGDRTRGIISFQGTQKKLVLNSTNGQCLKAMWGRDTGEWVGKRVTLFPAPIQFGDNEVAIRVRGSPDLKAAMEIEIKLPRRRPMKWKLVPTGKGAPKAEAQPAAEADEVPGWETGEEAQA